MNPTTVLSLFATGRLNIFDSTSKAATLSIAPAYSKDDAESVLETVFYFI